MDKTTHPYFVPDDTQGDRRDTAVLLVGTATENSIDQREIAATQGGFRISENVYKALGWDEGDDIVTEGDARLAPGEVVTGGESESGYADWEYADLRAEASRRSLETDDLKTATLVTALQADDDAVEDDDADSDDADSDDDDDDSDDDTDQTN